MAMRTQRAEATRHRFDWLQLGLSLALVAVVGVADLRTQEASLLLLYAVPVVQASAFGGRVEGLVVAVACALAWYLANVGPVSDEPVRAWNALNRLGVLLLIAYTVSLQVALRRSLSREQALARTDTLTGLLNGRAMLERVEAELARCRRHGHAGTLAFIDLDNFKQVNDSRGHAAGDRLLRDVGGALRTAVREVDLCGRLGGDEFAVFFVETGAAGARPAAEKVLAAVRSVAGAAGTAVTASMGVVSCEGDVRALDALVNEADALMYEVKSAGRDGARFSVHRA